MKSICPFDEFKRLSWMAETEFNIAGVTFSKLVLAETPGKPG